MRITDVAYPWIVLCVASEEMFDTDGGEDPNRIIKCNGCDAEFTYQELYDGNSEKITLIVEDVKKDI